MMSEAARMLVVNLADQMGFSPDLLLHRGACTLTVDKGLKITLRWYSPAISLHAAVWIGHLIAANRLDACYGSLLANSMTFASSGRCYSLDSLTADAYLCQRFDLAQGNAHSLVAAIEGLLEDSRNVRELWNQIGWIVA